MSDPKTINEGRWESLVLLGWRTPGILFPVFVLSYDHPPPEQDTIQPYSDDRQSPGRPGGSGGPGNTSMSAVARAPPLGHQCTGMSAATLRQPAWPRPASGHKLDARMYPAPGMDRNGLCGHCFATLPRPPHMGKGGSGILPPISS